jgi:hypothetical protein
MTKYTEIRREDKLQKQHRDALKKLSDGEIYWCERRLEGKTGSGTQAQCHTNVQYWVDKIGGSRVDGWAYNENKFWISKNIHIWYWHSLWLTPENRLVDVTVNEQLGERNKLTFLTDEHRETDVVEGIGYNNIVIIGDAKLLGQINTTNGTEHEQWTAFWSDSQIKHTEGLDEFDGRYRWFAEEYVENNAKLLEQKYDVKVEDGKLTGNKQMRKDIFNRMMLEFAFRS